MLIGNTVLLFLLPGIPMVAAWDLVKGRPEGTWYLSSPDGNYVSEYNKLRPGNYHLRLLFTNYYSLEFDITLYDDLTSSRGAQVLSNVVNDKIKVTPNRPHNNSSLQVSSVRVLADGFTKEFIFNMTLNDGKTQVDYRLRTNNPNDQKLLNFDYISTDLATATQVLKSTAYRRFESLAVPFRKPIPAYAVKYNTSGRWHVSVHAVISRDVWADDEYTNVKKRPGELKKYLNKVFIYVNWLYEPLNIVFSLDSVEVFENQDKASFGDLRDYVAKSREDGTVGKEIDMTAFFSGSGGVAWGQGCCRKYNSVFRSAHHYAQLAGGNFAHEAGHNLGLGHASCPSLDQSCIMRTSWYSTFYNVPTWSEQTYKAIHGYRENGWYKELHIYHSKPRYGPICGNNIVEEGEECDSGTGATSYKTCCDPDNCRIRSNLHYCGGYESIPKGGPFQCSGTSVECPDGTD